MLFYVPHSSHFSSDDKFLVQKSFQKTSHSFQNKWTGFFQLVVVFFLLPLPSIFSSRDQSNFFLASHFYLLFLKGIHTPSLQSVAGLNWKIHSSGRMIATGLLGFTNFWNRNKTGAGMVPYLHVRFPFVMGEKSSHICFDYVWESLFKMLPVLTDCTVYIFWMGRKALGEPEPQWH